MSGGGNMKRSIKLISVILTAAMLMSFASCAKRRTGAERIKSDSEAKQEAGLETGFTDPTDTAPTDTEPTDTAPTETAPTQTDPLPTISATPAIPDNSTNTGSQADGTNTAAYLFISGILFTAGDLNTTPSARISLRHLRLIRLIHSNVRSWSTASNSITLRSMS